MKPSYKAAVRMKRFFHLLSAQQKEEVFLGEYSEEELSLVRSNWRTAKVGTPRGCRNGSTRFPVFVKKSETMKKKSSIQGERQ